MKTHSFGSGVIMFITALALIAEIVFLLAIGTGSPVVFFLFFIVSLYFFWRASFRYGHYKPDKLDLFIEENRVYTFRGYDPVTSILFLVEHIHLEIPIQESQVEISGFQPSTQQIPTNYEPVDFEEASLYRGEVFSENLTPGETVIAVAREDRSGEVIIGVERYQKAA